MRLKDELEAKLGGTVKLGMAAPGALNVFVDGRRIFSKQEAGRFPSTDELVAQIDGPRPG